jgi:inorganic pyrophosphatase
MNDEFWEFLEDLVINSQIVYERRKGTAHPRYPNQIYPVDYGYLAGTGSIDGSGVDIWLGSLGEKSISGVLCTVDLQKRDTELKILYSCTEDEIGDILRIVNSNKMRAIRIMRKS